MKHHVTSTVHEFMGDPLHKAVTKVSTQEYEFIIWDKSKVFLSRNRVGSNIIFVDEISYTVNELSSLISTKKQWMNYT